MAIDYTKLFTLIGKHVDKINDYYSYIATYTSDESAIESTFSSQSTVWLADGLKDMYDSFRATISSQISELIDRISTILTDETLVTSQMTVGVNPSLADVLVKIIDDMNSGAKSVQKNTVSNSLITYDVVHSGSLFVLRYGTLDGTTPPVSGGQPVLAYNNVTSELGPTSESVAITCVTDSESGGVTQGSEVFTITGSGAVSDGYSPAGENIGVLGSITSVNNSSILLLNPSFDNWTSGSPDDWTNGSSVNFEEITGMTGTGSALRTLQDDTSLDLTQTISKDSLKRNRAYAIVAWIAKDTDVASDQTIGLTFTLNGSPSTINMTPTTTTFVAYGGGFVTPAEITSDLEIALSGTLASTNDKVIIDSISLVEVPYYGGIGFVVTTGADKVLVGDNASWSVTNNDTGKFQTFFRKAYKVQLPSSNTPTISDSLVA